MADFPFDLSDKCIPKKGSTLPMKITMDGITKEATFMIDDVTTSKTTIVLQCHFLQLELIS